MFPVFFAIMALLSLVVGTCCTRTHTTTTTTTPTQIITVASDDDDDNEVEEKREVSDFSQVDVAAGMHAVVTVGPKAPLTLRGEARVLQMVTTEVHDGRLQIGWKHGNVHDDVEVTVQAPKIVALRATGGGEID